MTNKTGLEVVGYAYEHQDYIGSVIGGKGEWAPNEIPLVTLASAQAAVAAAQVQRESTNRCLDADLRRITELEAALRQARDALDVATDSLGSFTMDHGPSQVDFDNIDTALAALLKINQILQ